MDESLSIRMILILLAIFACSSPTEPPDQQPIIPQITLGGAATARSIHSGLYRVEIEICAINAGGVTIEGSVLGHIYLFRHLDGKAESILEHKTEYIFPSSAPYKWTPMKHGRAIIPSDSLYTATQVHQLWWGLSYEIED